MLTENFYTCWNTTLNWLFKHLNSSENLIHAEMLRLTDYSRSQLLGKYMLKYYVRRVIYTLQLFGKSYTYWNTTLEWLLQQLKASVEENERRVSWRWGTVINLSVLLQFSYLETNTTWDRTTPRVMNQTLLQTQLLVYGNRIPHWILRIGEGGVRRTHGTSFLNSARKGERKKKVNK